MMHLFDTRTRALQELHPVRPGHVGVYVCGPTVQAEPHIGHLRSALSYDVLRRWLVANGFEVTLVRNVTDIDDKILAVSDRTGEPWWALAYRIERSFSHATEALRILPPTCEPRATGHIVAMQQLIAELIDAGHAYQATDGSASVYFDTESWPDYGELTHQDPASMSAADDTDPMGKRDPRDFALWKARKAGEPDTASWPSPWGVGRPGWHVECSAMSTRYLGDEFDIHGGGLDLRFPHHENELAQARAAGRPFARLWIHNGLVSVGDQKMSKSLGNSITAERLLATAPALTVRYFLEAAHYRSTLEYSDSSLAEAQAAVDRITGFVDRAVRVVGPAADVVHAAGVDERLPKAFVAAMDDDLGVPAALAVLHERIREGNARLSASTESEPDAALVRIVREVHAMLDVLGLWPADFASGDVQEDHALAALSALVNARLHDRSRARADRDYALADQIRDELGDAGIAVEDTAHGAHWSLS